MDARIFTDMTGRRVGLPYIPARIVSLVPSQTELLYDLGLGEAVAGITKFCVHPEHWFRNKTRIGGTKTIHIDRVRALKPDLILANKEENTREQVELLAREFPVWTSDINTIPQALEMIEQVGLITGKSTEAARLVRQIREGFAPFEETAPSATVAYMIWRDPWMTAGRDTFIHDMLETIGWKNVFTDCERYPEISPEELLARKPEMILLSSEPYPFREKHLDELRELFPGTRLLLVDGEMFSWYGSRMKKAAGYLKELVMKTNMELSPPPAT